MVRQITWHRTACAGGRDMCCIAISNIWNPSPLFSIFALFFYSLSHKVWMSHVTVTHSKSPEAFSSSTLLPPPCAPETAAQGRPGWPLCWARLGPGSHGTRAAPGPRQQPSLGRGPQALSWAALGVRKRRLPRGIGVGSSRLEPPAGMLKRAEGEAPGYLRGAGPEEGAGDGQGRGTAGQRHLWVIHAGAGHPTTAWGWPTLGAGHLVTAWGWPTPGQGHRRAAWRKPAPGQGHPVAAKGWPTPGRCHPIAA